MPHAVVGSPSIAFGHSQPAWSKSARGFKSGSGFSSRSTAKGAAAMGRPYTRDEDIGGQPVVDDATFSAIVIMVMLTTMATPPAPV